MALKTLAQSDSNAQAAYDAANLARPNGIACPTCGEELKDTDPNKRNAGTPETTDTECSGDGCSYTGTRKVY